MNRKYYMLAFADDTVKYRFFKSNQNVHNIAWKYAQLFLNGCAVTAVIGI